jgi:hypothetical protein
MTEVQTSIAILTRHAKMLRDEAAHKLNAVSNAEAAAKTARADATALEAAADAVEADIRRLSVATPPTHPRKR